MMHVARAVSLMVTLDRDLDWYVDHAPFRATFKRQQTVAERRKWLVDVIERRGFTKADIEGDRVERRKLRKEYRFKWGKSDATFREDLKSLGYKPR